MIQVNWKQKHKEEIENEETLKQKIKVSRSRKVQQRQRQRLILDDVQSNSDADQGFVPTKVEINDQEKVGKVKVRGDGVDNQRPVDWQPRKQPTEIYRRFKTYSHNWKYSSNQPQHNITTLSPNPPHNHNQTHQQQPISLSLNQPESPQIPNQQTQAQIIRTQPALHPYKKFIQNDSFILVYSRIKDKSCLIVSDSDEITNNQVNLAKVLGKYDRDHYSVIRGFDYQWASKGKDGDKRDKDSRDGGKKQSVNNMFRVRQQQTSTQKHTFLSHHNLPLSDPMSQTIHSVHQPHQKPSYQTIDHQQITSHHNLSYSTSNNHNDQSSLKNNSSNNSYINLNAYHHSHSHPHPNSHLSHQHPHQQSQFIAPELQFDSKFQCGNLLYVFKNKHVQHYYLFLHNDTNSYGYNQWFYFAVKNMYPGITYKFSIVNLVNYILKQRKKHSMFKQGMKISVFSLIQSQIQASQQPNSSIHETNGWKRMGNNIKYQRSCIKKNGDKKFKFYCLSFELQFGHEKDYVKIAMNVPYSYSRLMYQIKLCGDRVKYGDLQKKKDKDKDSTPKKISSKAKNMGNSQLVEKKNDLQSELYWDVAPIGYSISNNAVPEITLTHIKNKPAQQLHHNPSQSLPETSIPPELTSTTTNLPIINNTCQPSQSNILQPQKKLIIILARQHPGQTWSSFLMEQILYILTQPLCSANTYYNEKDQKYVHRWLLENYVFKIIPMVNVDGVIYGNFRCDLGGFDLNRNWRNPDKNLHPQINSIKSHIQKLSQTHKISLVLDLHGHSKSYNTFSYSCKSDQITARVLSLLISQITPIFKFQSCTFGISKYKETTARAVMYKIVGHQNVVTIQNSFFGAKVGDQFLEYCPEVVGNLARGIIEGIGLYLMDGDKKIECLRKVQKNIQEYLGYERMGEIQAIDSGSQSEPFIDQISIKQKIKKILPKSFKALESQLEQQQKQTHKKPKIQKSPQKQQPQKQLPTPIPKKQARSQLEPEQQAQTFIQRTSLTHYKRNSKELTRKDNQNNRKNAKEKDDKQKKDMLNSEKTSRQARFSLENDNRVVRTKVGDVGLPFYIREKSTLVPIKLKNDSLQIFKDAYNATKGNFTQYQSNLHKTSKPTQKKVRILNDSQIQSREQFPLLCVLSEQKKRQSQLQKTHNNTIFEQQQREHANNSSSLPPKVRVYVQNEKLEHLKKNNKGKTYGIGNTGNNLNQQQQGSVGGNGINGAESIGQKFKERNSKDATLISKIWRQNFARYGKDLNVFFGGIRGN